MFWGGKRNTQVDRSTPETPAAGLEDCDGSLHVRSAPMQPCYSRSRNGCSSGQANMHTGHPKPSLSSPLISRGEGRRARNPAGVVGCLFSQHAPLSTLISNLVKQVVVSGRPISGSMSISHCEGAVSSLAADLENPAG